MAHSFSLQVKLPLLAASLSQFSDVKVIATKAALRFLDPSALASGPLAEILDDGSEWHSWKKIGAETFSCLHLCPRNYPVSFPPFMAA